ncbi:MAG TPA: 30S ribosomal protein S12 methylthiotransferase RimO [Kofleriaceae bacterium]|nr:30S ribosomal protein S12 methylthiotransferase RimO [Kofleriaceae bacterium]
MGSDNVYFVSLGCPKNRVDTEVMLGHAGRAGMNVVGEPDDAEVIVVNTCGFLGQAIEESIDTILEMAEHKHSGRCQRLIVTGCLSQRHPEELRREIPEIDHILGSGDYGAIADYLSPPSLGPEGAVPVGGSRPRVALPVITVSETPAYLYDHTTPRASAGPRHTQYIKIAEGCDRPCGFCIIPKLRGPQRSRHIESVVAEARALAAAGARELCLVAQDLTRYGADLPAPRPTLAELLWGLAEVDGIRWIRLHYTYPSAFTDDLIDAIARIDRVANYVDVPLQHIDPAMLKIMRRGHSEKVARTLIDRLRARIDDVVIRTTLIVGHPGETDAAFDRLARFVRDAELDRVGVFTYSPEAGTHSATLPDKVPIEVAEARRDELLEIQRQVSRKKLERLVGQTLEVLIEGPSEESELLLEGRYYGQAPEIDGTVYLTDGAGAAGDLVRARVTAAADHDLAATIL